jgi:murein DD-endopeptidase MepM/ murein hydrolase activator NlpD
MARRLLQYPALTLTSLCCFAAVSCTPSPLYHGGSGGSDSEGNNERSRIEDRDVRDVNIILRHPLGSSVHTKINSPFGIRTHPVYGTKEFHQGVDFEALSGDDVYAAAAGKVIYSGRQKGYGKVVILDHGGGITSVYAHLGKTAVRKGDKVNTGQLLGKVGISGNATGFHLHFELRISGKAVNPIDYMEIR